MKIPKKVLDALREASAMSTALQEDVARCYVLGTDPFVQRTIIRNVFAAVEASVFQIQSILKALNEAGMLPLSSGELSILNEETYRLKDNGQVTSVPRFAGVERQFRFLVWIVQKNMQGGDEIIDFKGNGWKCFQQSLQIRHRLTHPKTVTDLAIVESEHDPIVKGCKWFFEALMRLTFSIAAFSDGRKISKEEIISEIKNKLEEGKGRLQDWLGKSGST